MKGRGRRESKEEGEEKGGRGRTERRKSKEEGEEKEEEGEEKEEE